MNHPEGLCPGVVYGDLIGAQLVFENVVFHAFEGEGAGRVETEGFQVAGHHFHGRHAARFHRLDKGLARGEGIIGSGPPETQPSGISEVGHLRGPRGGDIEDAGARQAMLQTQARKALLGGRRSTALGFAAAGVLHGMGLIEGHDAVELVPEPVENLDKAGAA